MRPDDSTLTPAQLARVRKEADRALRDAGAYGVFPTPIAQIMEVARVVEVKEDVLNQSFVEKLRAKVRGAGQTLRSALSKIQGLFHASEGLIFIDHALMEVKKRFVRLHECAHGFLPWQRGMYAVVEDCEKRLDPDVADSFDREANVFASEVMFQLDTFQEEARDRPFDIFTPVRMTPKYGASIYAAVRQYVTKNHRSCAVLVLNPPEVHPELGFTVGLRRFVASPSFIGHFGILSWPDQFSPSDSIGAMVPVGGRKASGKREIRLRDRHGAEHSCVAEAFTQRYQVFVLMQAAEKPEPLKIWVPGTDGHATQ
jgi:Zn-dependent peptidase ImmA (M78 family)